MNNRFLFSELDTPPNSFLREAYRSLGYENGNLFDAISHPLPATDEIKEWLEKGDWLVLAKKIGAEKVFFVKNDPVIVFCEFQDAGDVKGLINAFRQAWCMARPACLFIALPGELRVYSLNNSPARSTQDWEKTKPLAVAYRLSEVAEKLQAFRREEIESGRLFADKNFGDINERADKRLIQDLKAVRNALLDTGLKQRYAHALIGRSIFVRYLEDRGVLTPAYFEEVAKDNLGWQKILNEVPEKPALIFDVEKRLFVRVLQDKDFTYALFRQLTEHFNGDMFPRDYEEELAVDKEHLSLLRQFLLGEADSQQPSLFFWAYDFEIVPIELVSSIYEEFYHENNEDDKGTHYTPSVLVEYILSQILTLNRLATNPRVLDPACGSGIFLVEAFRRIVRYRVQAEQKQLSARELRDILRTQITGIEINKEATHVAAFSLYLALLHYQEPRDILAQIKASNGKEKPLPHLIFETEEKNNENHYHTLFNTNAFGLLDNERIELQEKLKIKRFAGRTEVSKLNESSSTLQMTPNSFDVVIGNPPWGFKKGATQEIEEAQTQMQRWCNAFGWPIGDKEPSQAFIARTLSLLKQGGVCGLLVSTGVFLKHHENSQKFRERWLSECTIKKVVNFAHVRDIFFTSGIAPFAFVLYSAEAADAMHRVLYWSAKKTKALDKIQAVILRLPDLRQVKQTALIDDETLWKVYWWGSHRDAALIATLNSYKRLGDYVNEREWNKGQGYTPGHAVKSDWLKEYKELPIDYFGRYGAIKEDVLTEVPEKVHRRGIRDLYIGWRVLIKRGITQAHGTNGQIEARLDGQKFCFRNSVHAIGLNNAEEWERKFLIGILWSSVARYYFFMTASSWGTWHHEIHLEEILKLPVHFSSDAQLKDRIVEIVDELQGMDVSNLDSLNQQGVSDSKMISLERSLDEAMFALYNLNEPERDLILDTCEVGLEFFYKGGDSNAAGTVNLPLSGTQGTAIDLPKAREREEGLEGYLYAFLQIWNRELAPKGEFRWHVIQPSNNTMLAVVFTTQEVGTSLPHIDSSNEEEWGWVLERCSEVFLHPISRNMYIDGIVRAVTDTDIFIIKRNERRLWTRSQAREDAEATLLQAIHLQEASREQSVQ